ncbi:MAG: hypothetical protein JWN46_270, partial [Acidimicrobiales bacterium]|nr:hypothetical protein [Acidimicrobiales bacterium]
MTGTVKATVKRARSGRGAGGGRRRRRVALGA